MTTGGNPRLSTIFEPVEVMGNFTLRVATINQTHQLGASNSRPPIFCANYRRKLVDVSDAVHMYSWVT